MIKKQLCLLVINLFIWILFNATPVFADPQTAPAATDSPLVLNPVDQFDSVQANKILSQTEIRLNSQTINIKELQDAISTLNNFQLQAKKCVTNNSAQAEKINQRLNEISAPHAKITALSAEQSYLNGKKNELVGQLSECRLFLLRSEDITGSLDQKVRDLIKTRLLDAHQTVLDNLKNLPHKLANLYQSFDWNAFIDDMGISYFSQHPLILTIWALLIVSAITISLRLRTKLLARIGTEKASGISKQAKQTLLSLLKRYLPTLAVLIISSGFLTLISLSQRAWLGLALISLAFTAYWLFIYITRFFFYAPKPAISFTQLPFSIGKSLTWRIKFFAILILTAYIIYILFQSQDVEGTLTYLFRTIFITLTCLSFMAIIWVLKDLPQIIYHHSLGRFLISSALNVFFIVIIVAEWLGYHILAFYLLRSIILTIVSVFFAKQLYKLTGAGFDSLQNPDNSLLQGFRNNLGLKKNEQPVELFGLRTIVYCLIWIVLLLILVGIWGIGQVNFQNLLSGLLHGFQIATFNLVPLRIIFGLLCFILFSLSVRWLRSYIAKSKHWQLGQQGGRDSLALIVGYIGFALAFILGALIAGVNFSGLLIIAGALSVGIGLGLQSITNNFVSGLVLLIERPIKVGDRIIVGDAEGYVRKISLRSTHLTTLQRTEVILPNSDLIAKPVTNYMLYDLDFQVLTTVGIAYGSDTELAKETLLAIARKHPQVVLQEGSEPQVYFMSFGDSSLEFRLYCIIKDVNLKTMVLSDLNFAIEKEFRRLNINIAFPQREITIKK